MSQFAGEYLKDEAKRLFEKSVPTELRQLRFHFERDEFEKKLNFRVFHLENDVYVSAPFDAVGKSVKVKAGRQRKLNVEGVIVDEKLRARHA